MERAPIVLAPAEGQDAEAICAMLGVARRTVSRWLDRYDAEGCAGLEADWQRSVRTEAILSDREAAFPRIIATDLARYQRADGGVIGVPEVLRAYVGTDRLA